MKKLIIDGHNLIPKIPGMMLSDPEDESKLLRMLQEYCRISRSQAELFFDGSPHGFQSKVEHGLVRVHSIRIGRTADDAIISFLRNSGKNSRNMTVVSSDRRVQAEVRALHAEIMSSENFSSEIQKSLTSGKAVNEHKASEVTADEVDEWLRLFNDKKGTK